MFEYEAIYGIITYVGNKNMPEVPLSLYDVKAGGNKDTYAKRQERFAKYKEDERYRDEWFGESRTIVPYIQKVSYQRVGNWRKTKRSALRFFLRSDEWADCFIKDCYGDVQSAYRNTKSKDELADVFLKWFSEKRKELRERMGGNDLVEISRKQNMLGTRGRSVNSHGGVANLLKVLTKTMEKQGADIRSIAKVQYEVCTQAGIYIPDEFIEDVCVIVEGTRQ